jgi:bis(5'-nucleosyl)-tetraphosphatase (symmetrical)
LAVYAIGDIQGCYNAFRRLLDKINFDPQKDHLWLTGDLVNRGSDSLKTLRFIKNLGQAVTTVLGNHDLHLLALHFEAKPLNKESIWLEEILNAHDRESLMEWLRQKPLVHYSKNNDRFLVHAGIHPDWTIEQAVSYAKEIAVILQGDNCKQLLNAMYGNTPHRWSKKLKGIEKHRFIINTFTRMRMLSKDNGLDFQYKGGAIKDKENLKPWFEVKDNQWKETLIVFGHWSALGLMVKPKFICLDTGYVWGRELTAINLDEKSQLIKISHQE